MAKSKERRESLVYHAKPKPGKIEVIPTKKYNSQRDLAIAYSPGVAEPCLAIAADRDTSYEYTSRGAQFSRCCPWADLASRPSCWCCQQWYSRARAG